MVEPVATPVTTPELDPTVATLVVPDVHVPPVEVDESVIVLTMTTVVGPDMVPAEGVASTVTVTKRAQPVATT